MSDDIPSTTLDPVDVTADAPKPATTNPTASPVYQPTPPVGGDQVTLTVGNVEWTGWQRINITRAMDQVPAAFDLVLTERYPNTPDIAINPGDPCTVKLGGDLVLTGYVDRYNASIDVRQHTVHVSGRSKSADLVDCAAFVGSPDAESYQVMGGTTLSIARQLAAGYGISVNSMAGDGDTIPQFVINLGETPYEILDRLSKSAGMVLYDMPDGSVMFARAGTEQMSSGFIQGVNVESAEVNFTMDQRYSLYLGFYSSTPILSTDSGGQQPPMAKATDAGVPRFRKRIIISEMVGPDGPMLQRRVDWEAARRAGRSYAVTVTTDSWRDGSQNLWAINHLATVNVPVLKVPQTQWCIGQVTYLKDENGEHAIVMLMPSSAFLPEPVPFMPGVPTTESVNNAANNPTSTKPADAPAPPAEDQPHQETGAPAPGNVG